MVGNHPAWTKVERSVVIVVTPTLQSNFLPMAKNVSNARIRIISQNFVGVQIKSQVVGLANLNVFQGKMFMKWKKRSANMTLILWSLNESSSQHLYSTPEKILWTLRISCLMKESKKLHWALTNVYLENRAGISSQDKFKLDTQASGDLLPVSVYHELFPQCNMTDLGKTIDKNVQLLTAIKSSIKQLGTVCLRVYHSQCNFLYTHPFFVVPKKCKTILGLPDLMQLNRVNFNCRVSESWDNDHTHHLHLTAVKKKLVPSSTKKSLYMGPGSNQSTQVLADSL